MPDGPARVYGYPPRRLRAAEAARYVGLSETAFLALALPAVRIGGTVGWLLDDLDSYLDSQRDRGHAAPQEPADADLRALAARLAAPSPPPRRRAPQG